MEDGGLGVFSISQLEEVFKLSRRLHSCPFGCFFNPFTVVIQRFHYRNLSEIWKENVNKAIATPPAL